MRQDHNGTRKRHSPSKKMPHNQNVYSLPASILTDANLAQKIVPLRPMTQEQIKSMRDRVSVLRRFL
jgi:hypothetical protein